MKRFIILAAILAIVGVVNPGLAGDGEEGATCTCSSVTPISVSWCGHCSSGKAFGQTIKSQKLIAALSGTPVKEGEVKCPSCEKALKEGGNCTHCKLAFHNGRSYKSEVAAALAKGVVVTADRIDCDRCKANFLKGKGFCKSCEGGIVAGMMFHKKDYTDAKKAERILASAVEASGKCEACAVAMLTDGQCAQCKVSFNKGRPTKG